MDNLISVYWIGVGVLKQFDCEMYNMAMFLDIISLWPVELSVCGGFSSKTVVALNRNMLASSECVYLEYFTRWVHLLFFSSLTVTKNYNLVTFNRSELCYTDMNINLKYTDINLYFFNFWCA